MALTAKQQAFVREYLLDLNATQAAIRAGYAAKWADRQAHLLIEKNRAIADAIQAALKKRNEKLEVTADRVVIELARIAFSDTTSAIRIEDGRVVVRDTNDLDENTRRAISEISETTTANGGTVKVKFHDKTRALELLSRHLGLLNDRLSIDAKAEVTCDADTAAMLKDPESRKMLAALYARSTSGGVEGAGKD